MQGQRFKSVKIHIFFINNPMGQNNSKLLPDTLIKYMLPFFNKQAKDKKKQSKLEELVKEDSGIASGARHIGKPDLKPLELIFLEDFVGSLLKNKNIHAVNKKTNRDIPKFKDIQESSDNNINNENEIRYSIVLERNNEKRNNFSYSVSVKYEENGNEEKLSVKVKSDGYSKKGISEQINKLKENKDAYSFEIIKEKQDKTTKDYSVGFIYENNYGKERLSITYKSSKRSYLDKRLEALHDFSDRVPGKHMNTLPVNIMGGILGFTYLGDNSITRRDDLTGSLAKMVDIHECIHTPDEYETRRITEWIMARERPRYIK